MPGVARLPRPALVALAAAGVLCLIVVGGLWLAVGGSGEQPKSPRGEDEELRAPDHGKASPSVATAPFAFHWPAGHRYRYAVRLETEGRIRLGRDDADSSDPLMAHLTLHAVLHLLSHGRTDSGAYVLAAHLERVERLDWGIAGQQVLPEAGMALRRDVVFSLSADGRILELHADPDQYAQAVNLLRHTLAAMQVVVGTGRSWTSQEQNPLGEVQATYRVEQDDDPHLVLSRRPENYTRFTSGGLHDPTRLVVDGAFAVTLNRAGHLERIEGREEVSALSTDGRSGVEQSLRMTALLVAVTREDGPVASPARRLKGLRAESVHEITVSPDLRTRLLTDRVDGLTMERLVDDLHLHGRSPVFPDLPRWLWRASGLLELHPERCWDLVAQFEDPALNPSARARIADLLAATGHPEAQAALRAILETPQARADGKLGELVQRFSLVNNPDRDTVAYLTTKTDEWAGDEQMAAAHALGATLHKVSDGSEHEAGAELLWSRLDNAETAKEAAAWIGAVGNAGMVADVERLVEYAEHGDVAVRNAVARALRKTQTPLSERVILNLAADRNSGVQQRALESMLGWTLRPEHMEVLATHVSHGSIDKGATEMLLTLLNKHRHLPPEATLPVLENLLDSDIRGRARIRARALQRELSAH